MPETAVILWPLAALLSAVGLRALAPRRAPGLYLAPAICTVAVLTVAAAYVATVWSN
jgi:hypothetical protein